VRALLVVVVIVAVAGTAPAVAHAGQGAILIPPARIDIGAAVSQIEDAPGFQMVAGIHWASLYPDGSAPIDVGFGVVSTIALDGAAPAMATTGADGIARVTEVRDPMHLVGGYGEIALRAAGTTWWRTWVGVRIESGHADMDGRGGGYVGVAGRVSTEAYIGGVDGGGGALVLGTFAVGIYGELSARRIDELGDDFAASAGLSFRIPFIFAG